MIQALKKKFNQKLSKFINHSVWSQLGGPKHLDYARLAYWKAAQESADFMVSNFQQAQNLTSKNKILEFASEIANKEGLWLEFGVFQGRSIKLIAKHGQHEVFGFDSFEGLPEDWTHDQKKGHFSLEGNIPKINDNRITLIKGWFDKTLPHFLTDHKGKISLLHIDSDLYASAKYVLETLNDRIEKGCIIVFDDFINYPGWQEGESKAFLEWAEKYEKSFEYIGFVSTHHSIALRIC